MTKKDNNTVKTETQQQAAQRRIMRSVNKWVKTGNRLFGTEFATPLVRFDLKGRTAINAQVGESDAPFEVVLWQHNAANAEITTNPESKGETDRPFWGIRVNIGIAAYSARNMQRLCDIDVPLQAGFLFHSTLHSSSRHNRTEWESTLNAFGLKPSDDTGTFDYDFPEGTGEFFTYLCNCKGKKTTLSKIQHGKAKRDAQYCCPDCGEVLREAQQ